MTAAFDEASEILLRHHLKKLKRPTVLREHEKIAPGSAPPKDWITSAVSPG